VTDRAVPRVPARVSFPRRLLPVAVAVAGLVALGALAGCRVEPGTAAYVGTTRYTNADVDRLFTEFTVDMREKYSGQIRQFIVRNLVDRDLSRRVAADHRISVPAADLTQLATFAQQNKLPPRGQVVRLVAEASTAMDAISPLATPQAPTDADKREVFGQLVAQGQAQPSDWGQAQGALDSNEMRQALGLRTILAKAAKQYHVTVNPQYRPIGIPLQFSIAGGQILGEVLVPLNPIASPAVSDRP
jgi:hypothetical protein